MCGIRGNSNRFVSSAVCVCVCVRSELTAVRNYFFALCGCDRFLKTVGGGVNVIS